MSDCEDTVHLKVTISRDVRRRFQRFIVGKHPDFLRGPLSEEVEKAITYYLDSIEGLESTPTHTKTSVTITPKHSHTSDTKYDRLKDKIKEFSNPNRQISSGLVNRAIKDIIGKDQRTIDKYLKILFEDDILYGNSLGGMYDVQAWLFNDYASVSHSNNKLEQK